MRNTCLQFFHEGKILFFGAGRSRHDSLNHFDQSVSWRSCFHGALTFILVVVTAAKNFLVESGCHNDKIVEVVYSPAVLYGCYVMESIPKLAWRLLIQDDSRSHAVGHLRDIGRAELAGQFWRVSNLSPECSSEIVESVELSLAGLLRLDQVFGRHSRPIL